jgi:hypothetical protein
VAAAQITLFAALPGEPAIVRRRDQAATACRRPMAIMSKSRR